MQVNPDIFKANDIRGIYPDTLDETVAYAVGRAFVTLLKVDAAVVGRDMRLSSPTLCDALIRGLMDGGADVLNIGVVSTDQYYYACATFDHAGVMVTASHNPAEYGGFKMVERMPQILSGDAVQDLRRIVETDAFAGPTRRGKMTDGAQHSNLTEDFIEKVLSLIDVDALTPLKVIADTGNGMVGPILKQVYSRLPAVELTGMYLEPDGNMPNHGPDPLQPENRAELQRRVVTEGADIGFAFDGDGDRCFAIDDRGEFVSSDFLSALIAQYLLEREPGAKIVHAPRCSDAVRDLITDAGGIPLIERVGHAIMKQSVGRGGRTLCHRGNRALLLQRFLLCRLRYSALSHRYGDALQETLQVLGSPQTVGIDLLHLRRNQYPHLPRSTIQDGGDCGSFWRGR